MSTAQPTGPRSKAAFSVEQYLAFERASQDRHEYYDGQLVAMAGEARPHGIISANLVVVLGGQLFDKPCIVFTKDTKVRSGLGVVSSRSASGIFSYPDLVFVCGEAEYFDDLRDVLTNPTAIVEVLSPSTENFDRGEKFHRYQIWNPSLKDYVLVAQDNPKMEHFHRGDDGKWSYDLYIGLDAAFVIPSIRCTLKLADAYRNVDFPAEPQ